MKGVHYLASKTKREIHKIRYFVRRWRTVPTPYRMIFASPNDVHHYLKPSCKTDRIKSDGRGQFTRRKNIGKVLSGSWDEERGDFKSLKLYRSLHQVFVKGEDWEETPFIKNALKIINQGESIYGCDTKAEIFQNRVQYIENIYEDMRKNGYQRQGTHPNDRRDRGNGHEGILHEVNVNIGRNGGLLFNNTAGHNRLSLAKILKLNLIPMSVIVRHTTWQKIRKEIYLAESRSQLSEKAKEKLDHPDIKNLHNFSQPVH